MKCDVCELVSGAHTDICSLEAGSCGEFEQFLRGVTEHQETRLLVVLKRLSENGSLENPEVYRAVPDHIGLFKLSVAGVELVCFRHERKLVFCGFTLGRFSREALARAQIVHNAYLADYHRLTNGTINEHFTNEHQIHI